MSEEREIGTQSYDEAMAEVEAGAHETEAFVKTYIFSKEDGNHPAPPKSKQIDDIDVEFAKRAVAPPYNPLLWAQLMEKSTRLAACVNAMADNTVGLGWRLVPKKPLTKDTPPEVRAAVESEIEALSEIFNFPNDEMPFTEICRLEKIDEEATGNGYIEIVKDLSGRPVQFWHVPSHTIWVDRSGGYIQRRGGKTVYFADLDSDKDKHAIDGTFHDKGSLPEEVRANELMHFKLYTPRDSHYGIPRVVPAAPAVTGNRLAAVRNTAFFENDAVPRLAILISGGKLADSAAKNIKEFLASDAKGPSNANRVMVVEAEGKKVAIGGKQEPVKVDLKPLTVGQTDDASFQGYRRGNDEEIREAFRIGSIFLGTAEGNNRAVAYVSRKITIEQVFKPEQIKKEYVINHKILRALGAQYVRFEFIRPKPDDPVDMAPADTVAARFGALTPNDMRRDRGLEPYPEDAGFGDIPFDLARIKYQAASLGRPAEGDNAAQVARSLVDLKNKIAAEIQSNWLHDELDEEQP